MVERWKSQLNNFRDWKPNVSKSPILTLLEWTLLLVETALKCLFLTLSCVLMACVSFGVSQLLQRQYFAKVLGLYSGRAAYKDTGDAALRVGGDIEATRPL